MMPFKGSAEVKEEHPKVDVLSIQTCQRCVQRGGHRILCGSAGDQTGSGHVQNAGET